MKQQALVVDDHPVVREGIRQMLSHAFPSIHIHECSGTQVIERICSYPWTFVTLDLHLPEQQGLDITRQIQVCCPEIPIIVVSMFSKHHYAPRALRAGAAAYVSKESSASDLVKTIKAVLRGKRHSQHTRYTVLSGRETKVLRMLARGNSQLEIAQALGITEKTVTTYKARLLEKLKARTTLELLRFAGDEGLLDPN